MLKSPSQKIYLTFDFRSQLAYMGMGQNLVPLVNIKIAGKWMFIPLKMVLIGIDPYPYYLFYLPIKRELPRAVTGAVPEFPDQTIPPDRLVANHPAWQRVGSWKRNLYGMVMKTIGLTDRKLGFEKIMGFFNQL
jgi:hypothetical protein